MSGNRIRELRRGRQLSCHELAIHCKPPTTAPTISKLEKGQMRLTLSWMERIAPALDVEPAELIAGKAMTDRHAGYVVVLDKNLREDDAQPILDAIRMIKGVVSVVPERGDAQLAIAEQRAIRRLYEKMREIETDLLGKF